jgi:hypothetical protein
MAVSMVARDAKIPQSADMTAPVFHQPRQTQPVSTAARIAVRRLFVNLEADAATFEAAFHRVPATLLDGSKWKGAVGSARAMDRIIRHAPRPPDYRDTKTIMWRYLKPLLSIPGDNEDNPPQRCLVMCAIIATYKKMYRTTNLFGTAWAEHSIARLCERGGPDLDILAVLFECNDNLMILGKDDGDRVYELPSLTVPAGPGFFIAYPRHVGPEHSPLCVCRTWYADEMKSGARVADAEAWRVLTALSLM